MINWKYNRGVHDFSRRFGPVREPDAQERSSQQNGDPRLAAFIPGLVDQIGGCGLRIQTAPPKTFVCFSVTAKEPLCEMFFVVLLLPDGTVVEPSVSKRFYVRPLASCLITINDGETACSGE